MLTMKSIKRKIEGKTYYFSDKYDVTDVKTMYLEIQRLKEDGFDVKMRRNGAYFEIYTRKEF